MSEVQLPEKSAAETTELKQIHDAIDMVCEDAAHADLWAGALSAFAQPIPEYGARDGSLHRVQKALERRSIGLPSRHQAGH